MKKQSIPQETKHDTSLVADVCSCPALPVTTDSQATKNRPAPSEKKTGLSLFSEA